MDSARGLERGVSSVIGVVLLICLAVVIASVAAGTLVSTEPSEPRPTVVVETDADPTTDTITVEHVRGDALDPSKLDLELTVAGTELNEQPPVPFFSADGFDPGPTGPFNAETDGEWTAGEAGTVRIASTNEPSGIEAGDRVTVTLVYGKHVLAERTVTARSADG